MARVGKLTSQLHGHGLLKRSHRLLFQLLHPLRTQQGERQGEPKQKFTLIPKHPVDLSNNLKLGFSIAISNLTANFSLQRIPLSVYAIILNLKPILVIVLGLLFGIESITAKKAVIILVSFIGASLIVDPDFFQRSFDWLAGHDEVRPVDQAPIDRGIRASANLRTDVLFLLFFDIYLRAQQGLHLRVNQKVRYSGNPGLFRL